MIHNMPFLPITNIKFHSSLRFRAPSRHRKYADVLQEVVYIDDEVFHNLPKIDDEVFHNLPKMCKDGRKSV